MFTVSVLHSMLRPVCYVPPPKKNYPQRYDFKGLTSKLFRNMDLSSIFGLNSRFGAVWGGIRAFPRGVCSTFAQQLGLSKSTGLRLLGSA